jgi:peptide/nickel transport system substrate-binding protein
MPSRSTRVDQLADQLASGRIDRRTFVVRAAGLGLSASAVASILAACGGGGGGATEAGAPAATTARATTSAAPKTGGRVSLRIERNPEGFDPAFEPGGAEGAVSECIYERLVCFKPGTYELVNQLAEEWTPSSDGLRYDFKLKPGIKWQGGYGEVTADDVKFTYERIGGILKPDIKSPYKDDWGTLKEVEVKDDLSGTIVLKEPFAPLMVTTIPGLSGRVLSRKAVTERGKKYGANPIGTGPYELAEWKQRESVTLKKFAGYSGAASGFADPPAWDEVRFVPIQEDNPATIALESGEVDFAFIPGSALDRFKGSDEFETNELTSLGYNWIGMNINHPNLKDVNVRQAVRYGVDVPAILEGAYDGLWTRASAALAPGQLVGYWKEAPVYERDVDKAKQFLSQAASVPEELVLSVANSDTGSTDVAEIVQASLKDVGLNVKVNVEDGSTFWGTLGGKAQDDRQLFYLGYTTVGPDPSWVTVWFTCAQIDVWNWMDWCSEEFSNLHNKAERESDLAMRQDMYVRMQQLWDENVNSIWVAWPTNFNAWKKTVTPSLSKTGGPIAWNFRPA